jgi:hypothetical protein
MIKLRNIIISSIVMSLFSGCVGSFYEKAFLSKYEFEDFSQFKGVNIFFRGQNVIFTNAPHLVNDTAKVGLYVVIVDENSQIVEVKWTTENNVNADTIKLQQLAQAFMKYEIPRLTVDKDGNVFVYLRDIERFTFVRFVNESEMLKHPRKWVNVKNNWYKPK